MSNPPLKLKYGQFQDLFNPDWLKQLDTQFMERLRAQNPLLHEDLLAYRHQSRPFAATAVSALLIACAPLVEEFIAELFNVEQELVASARATLSQQPIFAFKHWYVQRQARRRLLKQEVMPSFVELDTWLAAELKAQGANTDDRELAVATLGERYLQNQEQFASQIEQLTCWCIRALTDPQGQAAVKGWVSFHLPQKLDYYQLVPMEQVGKRSCRTHSGHTSALPPP